MELYENTLQLYIKRRLVLIKTAPSHLHLITLESLYHNCSVSHDSHSWLSGSSMLIHLRAGVKTLQGCTTEWLITSTAPIAVSFVIPKRISKCGYKLQYIVNPAIEIYGWLIIIIPRQEESNQVWCVWVWSWTLDIEDALAHRGMLRHGKVKIIKKKKLHKIQNRPYNVINSLHMNAHWNTSLIVE